MNMNKQKILALWEADRVYVNGELAAPEDLKRLSEDSKRYEYLLDITLKGFFKDGKVILCAHISI